ncbi:hypothetical protein QWY85_09230 [Neolewinella lacunae]|uniref:Uncharacterized protein n=1 Tax=Neolewinella lacunae TaxID=1517758 RepID=A0A923TAJ6_9BACT|nr:hypothetical protein [Neolewinella lacunae]MBC6996596.1 hypothetical protein [Neolewinella lacunae]MDN3634840.1 hypothetical protein [Neolewinella lacunae]
MIVKFSVAKVAVLESGGVLYCPVEENFIARAAGCALGQSGRIFRRGWEMWGAAAGEKWGLRGAGEGDWN